MRQSSLDTAGAGSVLRDATHNVGVNNTPASPRVSLPAALFSLMLMHAPMTHHGYHMPMHTISSCVSESCRTQLCQLFLHSCVQEPAGTGVGTSINNRAKQQHCNGGRTVPPPWMYAARTCLQILLPLISTWTSRASPALASTPFELLGTLLQRPHTPYMLPNRQPRVLIAMSLCLSSSRLILLCRAQRRGKSK